MKIQSLWFASVLRYWNFCCHTTADKIQIIQSKWDRRGECVDTFVTLLWHSLKCLSLHVRICVTQIISCEKLFSYDHLPKTKVFLFHFNKRKLGWEIITSQMLVKYESGWSISDTKYWMSGCWIWTFIREWLVDVHILESYITHH